VLARRRLVCSRLAIAVSHFANGSGSDHACKPFIGSDKVLLFLAEMSSWFELKCPTRLLVNKEQLRQVILYCNMVLITISFK